MAAARVAAVEPDRRTQAGREGEDAASHLYEHRGYRVIARNWRCRIGEIDLVLARGDTLVICEVKTRRGAGFGGGWEAVTPRKQAKVRAVAEAFLLAHRPAFGSVRFDVASVLIPPGSRARIEVFEDAF